jgi:methylenetetrahydrofolate reductase (NADPH)
MAIFPVHGHFVELLTPPQVSLDPEADFQKFQERYAMFQEADCVVSLTDNPMGSLSYTAPEAIDGFGLTVNPGKLEFHLNTFHRKTSARFVPGAEQHEQDLDILIQHARHLGLRYMMIVSGDGSDRLPRLAPRDLGYAEGDLQVVTSVQLLEYVNREYPGDFITGAAYNQYEPVEHEVSKLKKKIAAGARFIVTQPVATAISSDKRLGAAKESLEEMLKVVDAAGVPVALEAWMSKKLAHLLPQCVGYEIDFGDFEPDMNLETMLSWFPERKTYLSMLFGKKTLAKTLAIIG